MRLIFVLLSIVTIVGAGGCSSVPGAGADRVNNQVAPNKDALADLTDSNRQDKRVYNGPEGFQFYYPDSWGTAREGIGGKYLVDASTGKFIAFSTAECTKSELESWIKDEIDRKLEATESENTLAKPLEAYEKNDLLGYSYTIDSRIESSETSLVNVVYFDGKRRYEFSTAMPPVTEREFQDILNSLTISSKNK